MAEDRLRPAERYMVVFGVKFRKPSELEPFEVAFMALGLVSCVASIGMTIERLAVTKKDSNDFVFACLLFINILFILYYVLHGVLMERPFEILVSMVTVLIVLGYCIVDYVTNVDRRTSLKLVRLIVVCALGPVDIALAGMVAWKFFEGPGNLTFRLVGANMQLQRICKFYHFFTAFMGFGLQMVLILLVLLCISDEGSKLALSEKIIIGIGVPLSCVNILIGRLGARLENPIMTYCFLGFCVAQSAYIIYLFDRFGDQLEKADENHEKVLYGSIIAAAAIGLGVQIVLMALCVVVIRNFGKGLKEKLYQQNEGQSTEERYIQQSDDS
ncbi:uncharacterized protein LOC135684811 [Rhopilema esculentum]|uniref:uncharacterized protein LOC135684811 n=1 Tax=Rhopilema esculentum TaxID=499914 RepID=UPI0031D8F611